MAKFLDDNKPKILTVQGARTWHPTLDPTHSIQTTLYVETWFLKGKWIFLVLGFWIITAKGSETIKTLVIICNQLLKCPMINLTGWLEKIKTNKQYFPLKQQYAIKHKVYRKKGNHQQVQRVLTVNKYRRMVNLKRPLLLKKFSSSIPQEMYGGQGGDQDFKA